MGTPFNIPPRSPYPHFDFRCFRCYASKNQIFMHVSKKTTTDMPNVTKQATTTSRGSGQISNVKREMPSIDTPRAGYIHSSRPFHTPPASRSSSTSATVPPAIQFKPRRGDSRPIHLKYQSYNSTQRLNFSRLLVELKCKIIRTRKSLQMRPVTDISTQSYDAMFKRFRSNQRARNRQHILPLTKGRLD